MQVKGGCCLHVYYSLLSSLSTSKKLYWTTILPWHATITWRECCLWVLLYMLSSVLSCLMLNGVSSSQWDVSRWKWDYFDGAWNGGKNFRLLYSPDLQSIIFFWVRGISRKSGFYMNKKYSFISNDRRRIDSRTYVRTYGRSQGWLLLKNNKTNRSKIENPRLYRIVAAVVVILRKSNSLVLLPPFR